MFMIYLQINLENIRDNLRNIHAIWKFEQAPLICYGSNQGQFFNELIGSPRYPRSAFNPDDPNI